MSDKESVPTLRPCPFCGGEAFLTEDDVSEYPADGKVWHVTCLDSCSVAPGVYAQETKDDAIRKWNMRATKSQYELLCDEHKQAFNIFQVGGCLKCWEENECISRLSSNAVAQTVDEAHPEDFCGKCGGPNIVWFAPNDLWNKAVRAANEPEILCPICFVRLAEAAGTSVIWEVRPQNHPALNRSAVNAIESAAQEVVDIAYRDRGQIPHRDTITAVFSKHFAATTTAPVEQEETKK